MSLKVLHAASECQPLAKTGGLADVVAALPAALTAVGVEARVCLPAYRGVKQQISDLAWVGGVNVLGQDFGVLEGSLPERGLKLWLIDCPHLYERPGDPYHDMHGRPWHDNPWRFGCFAQAVAQLARGCNGWKPDVVHLHDWQAALAAAWIEPLPGRPRLVFTIHNLAYQGLYSRDEFNALQVPGYLWHMHGVEFWGGFSFMKAGINLCDAITTVSPTYAREILTPEFGHSLDGALRDRRSLLHGIVNGIDAEAWNPATDLLLGSTYGNRNVVSGKNANKAALKEELGLAPGEEPLLIFIGRFAEQKGADLILAARGPLLELPLQLAVLGTGDRQLERQFGEWAEAQPGRVALRLRYDEGLAHRMTAAADLQLMPSRFEPCGLNQMYAQRYGTIPVVRRTGGLADTVTDATAESLADGSATGVHFQHADVGGVLHGVRRGLELLADKTLRARLRRTGMARDFSWTRSARQYEQLYTSLLNGGHT
ncbi:MAG: glycogen synthase GlgA [Nevskia sp.]|nr:glycogen synthase GlgA [Nevskia sp.]